MRRNRVFASQPEGHGFGSRLPAPDTISVLWVAVLGVAVGVVATLGQLPGEASA